MSLISPMAAERDRLSALAISEEQEHLALHAAAVEAERAAVARATANMESDPGVIAARAALAKFHSAQVSAPPPALTRGRVKLPDVPGTLEGDFH